MSMDNIHVSMENILEENIQELSELSTFKSRKATIYFTVLTFFKVLHAYKLKCIVYGKETSVFHCILMRLLSNLL